MEIKLSGSLLILSTIALCRSKRDNSAGKSIEEYFEDSYEVDANELNAELINHAVHDRFGSTVTVRKKFKHNQFDSFKPVCLIIHDWLGNIESYSTVIILRVCENERWNTIIIDWDKNAESLYEKIVENIPKIGLQISTEVNDILNKNGRNWSSVHIVGIGLGAHIAGEVARKKNHNKPARITGLDPLGPGWTHNPNRLLSSDADYVEVLHTDFGGIGAEEVTGHVNFFANRGQHPQPGCYDHGCSHMYAADYFVESCQFDKPIFARKCSTLDEALSSMCNGERLTMGKLDLGYKGYGIKDLP